MFLSLEKQFYVHYVSKVKSEDWVGETRVGLHAADGCLWVDTELKNDVFHFWVQSHIFVK